MDNKSNLLFSKGFPTNRIPIEIPSTGQKIVLRETTITEVKSIAKTIVDNINRRQMDIIYDSMSEYLQKVILTDDVDIFELTELDRLYCLMIFFQLSFYRDATNFKCPNCGVDVLYRYDVGKYISEVGKAYVGEQIVEIEHKGRIYTFTLGWPTIREVSALYGYFYGQGNVTEQMEETQLGIHYVLSFIKKIQVWDFHGQRLEAEVDLRQLDRFQDKLNCINTLPSVVVFDEKNGLFSKVTGIYINRLENCFELEKCPQCGQYTEYGIPSSNVFYSLFYGMLRSIYSFCVQVECLFVFRYGCCLQDKEDYMTYNDLQTLVKQLQTTEEKSAEERKKIGKDNFTKGLFYIREILNTMVFPEQRGKGRD